MVTRPHAVVDREGLVLLCGLLLVLLVSGNLLPSGARTVTAILVGAVFLGAGSAWSYAVLRCGEPTRRAMVGAALGGIAGALILLADLLLSRT